MTSPDRADTADLLLGADAITRYINELLAPAKVSKRIRVCAPLTGAQARLKERV
jgi:hypothetical protein